jgi:single-stranded DNA-binding protein
VHLIGTGVTTTPPITKEGGIMFRTRQSLSGFIVSEPALTTTEKGNARLYVRVGQEHFHREEDNSFTPLEPSFHDLVVFGRTAERAAERLAKGDRFIAEGRVHRFARIDAAGVESEAEEFVAARIGHDVARTNYAVDRSRAASQEQANAGEAAAPQSAPPSLTA